jgi:hypothetical protein
VGRFFVGKRSDLLAVFGQQVFRPKQRGISDLKVPWFSCVLGKFTPGCQPYFSHLRLVCLRLISVVQSCSVFCLGSVSVLASC